MVSEKIVLKDLSNSEFVSHNEVTTNGKPQGSQHKNIV